MGDTSAVSISADLSAAARERDAAVVRFQRSVIQAAEDGLSQRDIAKILGITQPAVSQMIAAARSRMQLASGPIGRRLADHRVEVIDIARAHRASRIRVFGSVAEGRDDENSDLDLLVTMPANSGMLDVAQLGEELAEILGVPVDVIPEHMVKPDALVALKNAAITL